MTDEPSMTTILLRRLHSGDREAMDELLRRNLVAIHEYVHATLNEKLRRKVETVDLVQSAVSEFLRFAPHFTISSEEHLRALLCKIARHAICAEGEYWQALRRRLEREQPLDPGRVLDLDATDRRAEDPGRRLDREELECWMRLGIEMLAPEDRQVLILRQYEDLTYDEIGARLGISAAAARMRHDRALPRLAQAVRKLREGKLTDLL